jgi:hypothetical protein
MEEETRRFRERHRAGIWVRAAGEGRSQPRKLRVQAHTGLVGGFRRAGSLGHQAEPGFEILRRRRLRAWAVRLGIRHVARCDTLIANE